MAAEDDYPALHVEGLMKSYADRKNLVQAVAGVDFDVREGHFYTLLGPSGCGKTTTLRCVAGLERPTGGMVAVDGNVVSRFGSRTFVPPYKRPMGMVFQSYAIWPHLSVYENVAFPLRVVRPRLKSNEVTKRVEDALGIVQLSDYIRRPATNLSGGQQQRLALARALVRDPRILLLDEPLSNLDAKLRDAMRSELRALQRRIGVTTLYVTHDQAEALSMSNRIAVMSGGRIVQQGTPREIYSRPETQFVADFIGESNFVSGTTVGHADGGRLAIKTSAGIINAMCPAEVGIGDEVIVGIRPQDIALSADAGQPGYTLDGTIKQVLFLGEHFDYHVQVGDIELSVRTGETSRRFRRDEPVHLAIPGGRVTVFSSDHGVARMGAEADHDDDESTPTDARVETASA